MPYGWEGTVDLALHWPCVTDFSGLATYRLSGLRKGDEHLAPAYTRLSSMAPFNFYLLLLADVHVVCYIVGISHGVCWSTSYLSAVLCQTYADLWSRSHCLSAYLGISVSC